MSNVKVTKREMVSEEARAPEKRNRRDIRVTRDMLRHVGPHDIPASWKREGYTYRWMNSRLNKGRRFNFLYERGWDFALDPEGNKIQSDATDYLLDIPNELFEQLDALKREEKAEVTATRESKDVGQGFKDAGITHKEFTLKR